MADPIRQTVMEKFEDQLQKILTTGGYNSNLGSNINEWADLKTLVDTNLPAAEYRDMQDTYPQTGGQQEHTLKVQLSIIANCTAKTMRLIVADVTKCIGANLTLDTYAQDIRPISDEMIEMEQNEKRYFLVRMTFAIEYVTSNWNPYA